MQHTSKRFLVSSLALAGLLGGQTAHAQSFEQCPTEAFLIQDKIANLYGVQLATGFYEKLTPDDWGQQKMNALAFSVHDNYLYAYNYYFGTIVRIDQNYQLSPIPLSNLPNIGFYIGDIALEENAYYLYRPGRSYGLYRVSLDENSPDYRQATKIVNGSTLNMAIYDLAFHPDNGFAYSVDRWGNLWKIDVEQGSKTKLSNVGVSGTFGAVYFDNLGNLYISRNSDGKIFRINTNWGYPVAEFFAYGPSSSNNDGARCALAPIVSLDAPTTDFGDAPDSYGSSINNNGARHDLGDGSLYLGPTVETEPNAYANNGTNNNDNDGVAFVTGIEIAKTGIVEVNASAQGYLNAWLDSDKDGEFDSDEQIITEKSVNAGNNVIGYDMPTWAESGTTWSRFRLSSQKSLLPVGGVADGEVEDYQVDISEQNVTASHYPGPQSFATLAFEDNWPLVGDYDMNDLVVRYRLSSYDAEGVVLRIKIEGEVVAMGASYHNGFAFRIPGLKRNQVNTSRLTLRINGVLQTVSPLEEERDEAIFIIAENLWTYIAAGENCNFYRTEKRCGSNIQMAFSLEIPMESNVNKANLAGFPYDPFIFAAKGKSRNYLFGEPPGRRFEIHLKNQAPTEAFQARFFGRGDDASNPANGEYFINENGMPWAINIPYEWEHPLEYMDVKYAYPDFHGFATSSGQMKQDWYKKEKATTRNLFQD